MLGSVRFGPVRSGPGRDEKAASAVWRSCVVVVVVVWLSSGEAGHAIVSVPGLVERRSSPVEHLPFKDALSASPHESPRESKKSFFFCFLNTDVPYLFSPLDFFHWQKEASQKQAV